LEIDYLQKNGEQLLKVEYLSRYPEFAEQIETIDFKYGFQTLANAPLAESCDAASTNPVVLLNDKPVRRVAQFELIELVGTGAAGEVWKANDTRLQRTVAIKLPHSDNLSEAELHRFLREGRAAAQLRHPSIVPVHEVGRDGHAAYIVSDFIPGQSLRNRICQQKYTYRQAAELCAKLAEALHHAHEHGVVHRDLKPANVMIDTAGEPHLTDFGLAKLASDARNLTLNGQLLGTVAYMAPEQARGDIGKVDRRTDVYALGAILYELLVGQGPFQGDEAAVIHAIVNDEPRPPRSSDRHIPRDLDTICLKALEKEPRRRYASAQEMAVDLRRFLRAEPIVARRTGPTGRVWRWCRRRPAAAAALVLAMGIAIAAMAIKSLREENYRLQGYRPVEIGSEPSGASVAIVPIDPRNGELDPNPAAVMRPTGTTPLRTWLKPGEYFIEAVIRRDDGSVDFAEVYRTIHSRGALTERQMRANRESGNDSEFENPTFTIPRVTEVVADMVAVPIDEESQRKNPLLPSLIYVDPRKTTSTSADGAGSDSAAVDTTRPSTHVLSLREAIHASEHRGKRLPSAAEFDAIMLSIRQHQLRDGAGRPSVITDLETGVAEWTTTVYDFEASGPLDVIARLRGKRILKGYGDPDQLPGLMRMLDGQVVAQSDDKSPNIGFRGVRSGAPRFVNP
jgi:serine/threonine-protein kinase